MKIWFRKFALSHCFYLVCLGQSLFAGSSISGANGTAAFVDSSGNYSVTVAGPSWTFSGKIGKSLQNIAVTYGSDSIGPFAQIGFEYTADSKRAAAIRTYRNRAAFLFQDIYVSAGANASSFPNFTSAPPLLGHVTFAGQFGVPSFGGFAADSPFVFYDGSFNTFILSPASQFLISELNRSAAGSISSGISSAIAQLPAGFTHATILVPGKGINATFEAWGNILTDLSGKERPANDADILLRSVGVWTDNGATYYYNTAPGKTYAETLASLKGDFDGARIPLGYLQLDSWFYPKGPTADWRNYNGGIWDYSASTELFGPDLGVFQQALGAPLITHARWIDANSPYRQAFQVSGNVMIDPQYWESTASYLERSGVAVYEQDWLSSNAKSKLNLTDPDAFMDNMAAAMSRHGIHLQYCMAEAKHFLQSSRYNNLTTIRTSEDRFDRGRWNEFLFSSRLASALGAWPFTDVLMSGELDNVLLATLSAGPVGVGDAVGALNRENLLRAARLDGIIVKPDTPLLPLDGTYLNQSAKNGAPVAAAAYTDFGNTIRPAYFFAFPESNQTLVTFSPGDLGFIGSTFVYDYFNHNGRLLAPTDTAQEQLTADGRAYYVLSPVGASGMAMLGDLDQFVSLGRKRIAQLSDDGVVHLTVQFAAGEPARTITGYSPALPSVSASSGSASFVAWDASSQLFTLIATPGPDLTAKLDITLAQ